MSKFHRISAFRLRRISCCRIFLLSGLLFAFAGMAQGQEKDLYDFGSNAELARIDPAHAEFSAVDAHTLKIDFDNQGAYPTVTLTPPGGTGAVWDLARFAGIQATVTNKGTVAVRVALRVDNPGDWRLNHLNSSSIRLLPGETKQLQMTFGLTDGKPAYELDPARVARLLIFMVKPMVPTTIIVTKLTGFGKYADAVAARKSLLAATLAAKAPPNPPVVTALLDYASNAELSRLDPQHSEFNAIEGKKLQIDLGIDGSYPGITIPSPPQGWNLSKYAGIQVEITNKSKLPVRMDLLAGGVGDWGQDVSNNVILRVLPGETKLLQLTFGTDYGNPGVALDTARISRVLLFSSKLTEPVSIEIGPITGFGTSSVPASSITRPQTIQLASSRDNIIESRR